MRISRSGNVVHLYQQVLPIPETLPDLEISRTVRVANVYPINLDDPQ